VLAVLGGWTLQYVRRSNARAIQKRAAALAAGESSAIRLLQYGGLVRDGLRGAALTAVGLAVASLIALHVPMDRRTAVGLSLIAIGGALSAAVSGAIRSAGRGVRLKWLIGGAAVGLLLAVLT
jgi:hypothetical protein